jgi:tRNA-dihydrouridine synthase
VADAVKIPVIGNGDIASGLDVEVRRAQTNVKGVMIGRAAMANPWVFKEAKHYLATGTHAPHASVEERFTFMRRHCKLAIERNVRMEELQTMRSMRNRLMNYTKSIPGGKWLRQHFSQIGSLMQLEDIFASYLEHQAAHSHEHASQDSPSLA